jgi:uncharacterized membrane protein
MSQPAPPSTVVENIRSVAEMQKHLEQERCFTERLADLIGGFSGSMSFVLIHVVFIVAWFLVNTLPLGIRHFDPYPFILLAMIVSVEAVLLSTFVLMKQNRMQRQSDIRAHLNLQVDLLSEKEITKVLQMLRAISQKLDVDTSPVADPELSEMANTTSVDALAESIETELQP